MKPGTICEKGGWYCCLYHLKHKIRIMQGKALPLCNYNGLNCEGYWHLKKEIKEKTKEEKQAAYNRRLYANKRPRHRMTEEERDKWYIEKAKWDDWKSW